MPPPPRSAPNKRPSAFHPPGPARSTSGTGSGRSTSGSGGGGGDFTTASNVHATSSKPSSTWSRSKDIPPTFDADALALALEDEDDDDDEFGTAADLDDLDISRLAPAVTSAPAARPAPAVPISRASSDTPARQSTTHTRTAPLPIEDDESAPIPLSDAETSFIPGIPPALLARIMHESFVDKGTGISRGAQEMMERYVDLFVREAVARAAEGLRQRRIAEGDALGKGKAGRAGEDIWLGTEELENVAPGLLLDF